MIRLLHFIETAPFRRKVYDYLTDDEYCGLQLALSRDLVHAALRCREQNARHPVLRAWRRLQTSFHVLSCDAPVLVGMVLGVSLAGSSLLVGLFWP